MFYYYCELLHISRQPATLPTKADGRFIASNALDVNAVIKNEAFAMMDESPLTDNYHAFDTPFRVADRQP